MNKSLIFAALLVAPTVFAAPEGRESPVTPAMDSLRRIVGRVSPTPKLRDVQFRALFRRLETHPEDAGLLRGLVIDTILPSLEAARDILLYTHMAACAAGPGEHLDAITKQIEDLTESIRLLTELLPVAESQFAQLQTKGVPAPILKPQAQRPSGK